MEAINGQKKMDPLYLCITRNIIVKVTQWKEKNFIKVDLEKKLEMQLSIQFPPEADQPMAGASAPALGAGGRPAKTGSPRPRQTR